MRLILILWMKDGKENNFNIFEKKKFEEGKKLISIFICLKKYLSDVFIWWVEVKIN